MDTDQAPERRLRMTLNLGADTIDDVAYELRALANKIEIEEREEIQRVSGGYHAGYDLKLTVTDPDMDHERFAAESSAWLARRRAARKAQDAR